MIDSRTDLWARIYAMKLPAENDCAAKQPRHALEASSAIEAAQTVVFVSVLFVSFA